jgi:hypothetical protein
MIRSAAMLMLSAVVATALLLGGAQARPCASASGGCRDDGSAGAEHPDHADPHSMIYEGLVTRDASLARARPGDELGLVNPTTWRFRLRPMSVP